MGVTTGHNPVPDWEPTRRDQGRDGTGSRFVAPYDLEIVEATTDATGWGPPGHPGGFVAGRVESGGLSGTVMAWAEGVAPRVRVGQRVKAGTEVGVAGPNHYFDPPINGNIEYLFVNPGAIFQPLAQILREYSGDESPAAHAAGSAIDAVIIRGGGVISVGSGFVPNLSLLPAQYNDHLFPTISKQTGSHRRIATGMAQYLLDLHGYRLGRDGDFGPATDGAVRQFQGQHGLAQDGIVGLLTWGSLMA